MEQEFSNYTNSTNKSIRVAIIGAGASGCICAYHLLKSGIQVTLFDKGSPLRTLLPTGGGRCNLAHAEYNFKELVKNYPRGEKFLLSAFSKFSTWDTLALFEEMGIKTYVQEDNRIFPESNSAKNVRETILKKIQKASFIKKEVLKIEKFFDGFKILTNFNSNSHTDIETTLYTHIVIATGGHAGYKLLRNFDIKIIEPKPALVGLNTKENFKNLSGTVCHNVIINGLKDNLLFTHFGVSGPIIYKISSLKAFEKFPYELEIDLSPDLENFQEILNNNPHKEIKNILKEFLPLKIVETILSNITSTSTPAHQINGKTRDMILNKLHHFKVTITGTNRGEETVTAGGIDLNEINPKTMEVKKVPNLYCIGEVLNIDGFCGGFNLQNAWTTAFIASENIIKEKELS